MSVIFVAVNFRGLLENEIFVYFLFRPFVYRFSINYIMHFVVHWISWFGGNE